MILLRAQYKYNNNDLSVIQNVFGALVSSFTVSLFRTVGDHVSNTAKATYCHCIPFDSGYKLNNERHY